MSRLERRTLLACALTSLARTHGHTRPSDVALLDLTPEPITPAMRAAAWASDAREAFPTFHDDEEEDRLHRSGGAGYVDLAVAMDA